LQDGKYTLSQLEPKILNLKVTHKEDGSSSTAPSSPSEVLADDLSTVLEKNFENEFEIYKINRFIQPKIKVLKELPIKGMLIHLIYHKM